MGYIRALMGYRTVCEVAFQRVRLEEVALGGRAGFRVDSALGRIGCAGDRLGSGRGRVGPGSGRVGPGCGRAGASGFRCAFISQTPESVFVLFKITNASAGV